MVASTSAFAHSTADKTVATLLLFTSIAATIFGVIFNSRLTFFAALGIGVSSIYLAFRGRFRIERAGQYSALFLKATAILLFATLTVSIFFLRSSADIYQRSMIHFAAAALAFGLVTTHASIPHARRRTEVYVFLEIVAASAWIRFAPQFLFPGVIGIDSWFHIGVVAQINATGWIPTDNVYSGLTQFHIFGAFIAQISGLQPLYLLEVIGPMVGTIGSAFIFLLGRHLFGGRVGLVASACYGFYGYVVSTDFSFLAFGFGATLLLMAFYMSIRYHSQKSLAKFAVAVVSMVALINTHTVMALTLLIDLVMIWLVESLGRLPKAKSVAPTNVSAFFVVLFGVSLVSWWAYLSGSLTDLAAILKWGLQYESFSPTAESITYIGSVPVAEYVLNLSGLIATSTLAFVGTLSLLGGDTRHRNLSTTIAIWTFGALGLTSVSSQLSGLVGERWILAFQLFSSPLAALGVLWTYHRALNRTFARVLVVLLVAGVAFASITSPGADYDTSVYSPNTHLNLAFTDAELLSLTHLGQLHPVSLNVLNPEFAFYRLYLHVSTNDVGAYLANRSFVSIPAGLIVIRASVVASPIYYTRTLTRLDYNVTFALSQQFDRVYDSGSVLAFQTR